MTETPWTPGPWYEDAWDNEECMSTSGVRAADGTVMLAFCNCPDAPLSTDADARLIAAAPEMAELLEMAADYVDPIGASDLARALLARIRGEAE